MASKKLLTAWIKGPALADLQDRVEVVLFRLRSRDAAQEYWLSLRQASAVLEVSHHTLTSWAKQKLILREGRKRRFRIKALISFVKKINGTHAPYPSKSERFGSKSLRPNDVLRAARFRWAPNEGPLSPRELATRIGCHPCTIRRAIYTSIFRLGRRRAKTMNHWEISRNRSRAEFSGTIIP
jgi:hypothetical protein